MKCVLVLCVCFFLVRCSLTQCPVNFVPTTGCACAVRNSGFRVDCFRKSISAVVAAIRAEPTSFINNIQLLTFREIFETALPAGTFAGFIGLTRLSICCSSHLTSIQTNAFASLPSLQSLDLSDNGLRWLSRSSFTGIGNSLSSLDLNGNSLRNLRSDLEPFLSNLSLLSISFNTEFICDCHLSWLVNFIVTSTQPPVEHESVDCASPTVLPITDPSLTFQDCSRNFCELGYHNCAPNATCSLASSSGETVCTCQAGFTGSGLVCNPLVNPCHNSSACHHNATCMPNINEQTFTCTCGSGFSGNGQTCVPLDNPCLTSSVCHQNATCVPDIVAQTVSCTCESGFTGDGMTCTSLSDPCLTTTMCHQNATCVPDVLDQTVSCSCQAGYTGDGIICTPLGDPCQTSTTCHRNATCIPDIVAQSVTCICQEGFTGDGITCTPLSDPCSMSTICHRNAICVPDIPAQTVSCVCRDGFTGDGMTCMPLSDPCEGFTCHQNAICVPNVVTRTAMCVCRSGFTGDGQSCVPISDPCMTTPICDRNAICTPVDYVLQTVNCTCQTGYVGNGYICTPVHPCTFVTCHPDATCLSGDCVCNFPFEGDGYNCTAPEMDPCDLQCSVTNGVEAVCVVEDTGPYCVSMRLQGLQNQLSAVLEDPSLDPQLTSFTGELASAASNVMLAGDITLLVDLVLQSLTISNTSQLNVESFENLVTTVSELFDTSKHSIWFQLNQTEQPVMRLLMGLDIVAQQLFLQINTSSRVVLSADNVAIVAIRPGCDSDSDTISVDSGLLTGDLATNDSSVTLPVTVFGSNTNCMDVGVVVVIYDGVGPLLSEESLLPTCEPPTAPLANGRCEWYPAPPNGCANRTVDGVVISANVVSAMNDSVGKLNTSVLLEPVRIVFQHRAAMGINPTCAFLNEQRVQLADETWLTERCMVVEEESSAGQTVCECYHLTSFALLLSPTGTVTEDPAIQIVSKIGLCISILCLLVTIVLLFTLKLETKELHSIHRQLAIALCLAQTLFLVGVDRTLVPSPDQVCTTIAVLLHYLFLCTFAWQLVEGIHLYIFVVRVFYNKKLVWLYYPLGWGIPAVVVAITFGVRFCNYGSQHYCWITDGGGTNWAFHGPVIAVLAINIIIMLCITCVIVRAARKKDHPDKCLLCTLFHASLVLVPILGITWALGFFVVGDSAISRVIEWLFCIFTTLQGLMIFLMHCVLNRDVRKAFLKAIGCHEVANRQETVQNMRRSSAAYLRRKSSAGLLQAKDLKQVNQLKFTKKFTLKRKKKHTDEESYNLDTEMMLSNFSVGRRLSMDQFPGPLAQIREAEDEDAYSLPSSIPCTPEHSPQHSPRLSHHTATDTSSGISSS